MYKSNLRTYTTLYVYNRNISTKIIIINLILNINSLSNFMASFLVDNFILVQLPEYIFRSRDAKAIRIFF